MDSCSLHCKVPKECDKVTGHCFNGCQPGWGDPTCNTSIHFKYFVLYCFEYISNGGHYALNGCTWFVSNLLDIDGLVGLNIFY